MTLPTFVAKVPKIACLKLDVEGSEAVIIAQLRNLPAKQLPRVVMFEYSTTPPSMDGKPRDRASLDRAIDCLNVLRGLGYRRTIIVENHKLSTEFDLADTFVVAQDFAEDTDYGNIIAIRE